MRRRRRSKNTYPPFSVDSVRSLGDDMKHLFERCEIRKRHDSKSYMTAKDAEDRGCGA